jgi:hypothetical protein
MLTGFVMEASAVDVQFLRFTGAKEAQARELAEAQTNKVPSFLWSFFDAVRVDDWETATNLMARLEQASGRYGDGSGRQPVFPALMTELWQPVAEAYGAYETYHAWNRKWLQRFGSNIIESIPPASIYFGGTDPGRFAVSAMCESHRDGRPFFTLTQNQLADNTYIEYVRKMYGNQLRIPTADETRTAFEEYLKDASERMKAGRLKPGENIRMTEDGRVTLSGQVAVMEVNARIARVIVEKNAGRDVYVEESFPLDWMYPQLSPHGLILQLHPKPVPVLTAEMVRKDQDYWKQLTGELIGDWIREKTSIREISDFDGKVYLQKNFADFKGDTAFAKNFEAQVSYCKLRTAIAGVYEWRANHTTDDEEKERMTKAADLAYRQAFALCPRAPELVFRYVQTLVKARRTDDALLVAQTALRIEPENATFQGLVRRVRDAM